MQGRLWYTGSQEHVSSLSIKDISDTTRFTCKNEKRNHSARSVREAEHQLYLLFGSVFSPLHLTCSSSISRLTPKRPLSFSLLYRICFYETYTLKQFLNTKSVVCRGSGQLALSPSVQLKQFICVENAQYTPPQWNHNIQRIHSCASGSKPQHEWRSGSTPAELQLHCNSGNLDYKAMPLATRGKQHSFLWSHIWRRWIPADQYGWESVLSNVGRVGAAKFLEPCRDQSQHSSHQ